MGLVLVSLTCGSAKRAVYVARTDTLTAEDLAERLDRARITDVAAYGLGPLLATREGRAVIAGWIDALHRRGARAIAPVAGLDRVEAIATLLAEHPTAYFDALVTELEFWNRPDRERAFAATLELLAAMRRVPRVREVGVYLGYPTPDEAARLAAVVDFVYLAYAVRDPARAWSHVHKKGGPLRAIYGAFASANIPVWPIFYSTGEIDMRKPLSARGLAAAEAAFRERATHAPAGFVYFTLEALP